MNEARLWHPWLRIDRVLRVMLTRWSEIERMTLEGKHAVSYRSDREDA